MSNESPIVSRTLWARGGKRLFDLVGAFALLVLVSPLLLAAAVAIKLTSRGSLFFPQDRAGKEGVVFRLIKFRTMEGGRTPDPKEIVPLDHPEITQVGRLLRRFKVDELPQLLHVLSGRMSLVGPRPTLPDQVAAYDDFRKQRLLVRPGITGLAQVHGNTAISWDERILFDIAYVRRCSLCLDVVVFWRTFLLLLRGERLMTRPFTHTPYSRHVTPPTDYAEGIV